MKWAAIKANMPGIRNSLNAGVYLILIAHNTSLDARAAPNTEIRSTVSQEEKSERFS